MIVGIRGDPDYGDVGADPCVRPLGVRIRAHLIVVTAECVRPLAYPPTPFLINFS